MRHEKALKDYRPRLEPEDAIQASLDRGADPCSLKIANESTEKKDEIAYVLYLTFDEMVALVHGAIARRESRTA